MKIFSWCIEKCFEINKTTVKSAQKWETPDSKTVTLPLFPISAVYFSYHRNFQILHGVCNTRGVKKRHTGKGLSIIDWKIRGITGKGLIRYKKRPRERKTVVKMAVYQKSQFYVPAQVFLLKCAPPAQSSLRPCQSLADAYFRGGQQFPILQYLILITKNTTIIPQPNYIIRISPVFSSLLME